MEAGRKAQNIQRTINYGHRPPVCPVFGTDKIQAPRCLQPDQDARYGLSFGSSRL